VGILGTGSNSGRYNGRRIAESYGGHGYMLGDEGSGFDLGRRLLVAALDRQLPPWEAEAFAHWLQQDFEAYKATVYQAERPNAALAELALFLQDHQERPAFARLIDQAFEAYLQSTVLQYEAPRRYRLNFVGSVAYHYQAPLRNTCHRHGLSIDAILERPIDALAAYHQTRRYEQRH
jgi:N-acetylglucosamine kinase-like BadF-type ATPase